ncbi:helix-turn-helix domain-containing protein [Desulfofundulus salinus]|uniref:XRE family transcriptional regulator n=1 Tax=Desulfofundulus salinus TaxID=2419843 RepID=A0A494X0J2_9FIRM|nr:XRE family transcriptional regulator [Desulfofundulus salinum]
MTIRDLAAVVNMTPEAISNLETSRCKVSLSNLRKLADALNVQIFHLGCFECLPEKTLG